MCGGGRGGRGWGSIFDDAPSVEFMYLINTSIPGESYRRECMYLINTTIPGESYRREFMYLRNTNIPGESYRRESGLCCRVRDFFRATIN